MMNNKKARMGKSRDFGLPSGPGKGDVSRVTDQAAYLQNLGELFPSPGAPGGFQKIGRKSIKKYT